MFHKASSHQRCSIRKDVLKNFTKFTGKLLYQILFFNKIGDDTPATLLEKRPWHRYFSKKFYEIFKNIFLTVHSRVTSSDKVLNTLLNSETISCLILICNNKYQNLSYVGYHFFWKYFNWLKLRYWRMTHICKKNEKFEFHIKQ